VAASRFIEVISITVQRYNFFLNYATFLATFFNKNATFFALFYAPIPLIFRRPSNTFSMANKKVLRGHAASFPKHRMEASFG